MGMTIFDALRKTHREIEDLFGDVQDAVHCDRPGLAEELFQLLTVKIVSAMRAEHAVVYPRFAKEAHLVDEVAEALREHDGIERMIDLLRVGGLPFAEWCEGIAQLGTLVADHADSEECELFPIASLSLTTETLQDIAQDYVARMDQTAPIAGASITYDLPQPDPPRPLIVTFKAA
jgi:hypothetical protein